MPILHWLDRDKHVKAAETVPYRLLEADDAHSAGDAETSNMLIQGDNLEALKALLPYYAGRVKCIFIDPPYNTRSAFEHYDDNLEHTQWMAMMYPRLVLLRELLAEDGSIWVTIDDNEAHYLKVVLDEILGRGNFLGNVVWQSKDTPGNNSAAIAQTHNHLLAYRKSAAFKPKLLERSEKQLANYKNPDNDPRREWLGTPLTRAEYRERDYYAIKNDAGRDVFPPKGSSWRRPPNTMKKLQADGRIYWGKDGNAEFPVEKKYLSEVKAGVVNQTWWPYEFAGSTRNASAELKGIFAGEKTFDTPKPEKLVQRVFDLASNEHDLVLDSFLGSGTTAAVAHKMGRQYIGIEMGDHAVTLCAPRLRKVIEGEQGGISEAVGWEGGGGFRFYKLGASVFDTEGRINPEIRFAHLAAHIWFSETHTALHKKARSALLGRHNGAAYYLLYNGILGDKRPDGGNVLTAKILADLPAHDGQKVIYGEACRIGASRLKDLGIVFKQTPYDLKAR